MDIAGEATTSFGLQHQRIELLQVCEADQD